MIPTRAGENIYSKYSSESEKQLTASNPAQPDSKYSTSTIILDMPTTIAIVGHNGNVGKQVVPHLVKAHQAGHIKLIVLHRPSSGLNNVPADVER